MTTTGAASSTRVKTCKNANSPCYYVRIRWSTNRNDITRGGRRGNLFYMSGCYELGEYNLRRYMKMGVASGGVVADAFNGSATDYSRTRVSAALGGDAQLLTYITSQATLDTMGGPAGATSSASIKDNCGGLRLRSSAVHTQDQSFMSVPWYSGTNTAIANAATIWLCTEATGASRGRSDGVDCGMMRCNAPVPPSPPAPVAPVFTQNGYPFIATDCAARTAVGSPVTASQSPTYTLRDISGSAGHSARFTIDSSGQISIGATQLSDGDNSRFLAVATANGVEGTVQVTVTATCPTAVNRAPVITNKASVQNPPAATACTVGTPIVQMEGSDPDVGQAILWSVQPADARFRFSATSGTPTTLQLAQEQTTSGSASVVVLLTDSSATTNPLTDTVTINAQWTCPAPGGGGGGTNQAPTLVYNPASFSITMCEPRNPYVLSTSAVYRDPDTSGTPTYSIVTDPSGVMDIDARTGKLAQQGKIPLSISDLEPMIITVQVSDGASTNALTANAQVSIQLNCVDGASPSI